MLAIFPISFKFTQRIKKGSHYVHAYNVSRSLPTTQNIIPLLTCNGHTKNKVIYKQSLIFCDVMNHKIHPI